MDIQSGDKYRLNITQTSADGLANIYAGTIVTVREIVSADTKGAHTSAEDAVVVDFEDIGQIIGTDGQLTRGNVPRATAFSLSAFPTLFDKE